MRFRSGYAYIEKCVNWVVYVDCLHVQNWIDGKHRLVVIELVVKARFEVDRSDVLSDAATFVNVSRV